MLQPREPEMTAQEALEQGRRQLRETQARWPRIRRVAASLERLREDDHFSAAVRAALEDRPT